ncbi:hypothetical protein DSO57_1017854 [Entomophthora muscae]|uniref:Uncharacterized protein n=1 Tax=Entomophthora muscae TaxID=34485 RepID=A0ACC2ST74_9FUNG|nr:hypothetical protein DSO57_1017854 [Entomophthora muscae]
MNHLIFLAVLTACLRIGGHQYTHQHRPYNKPPNEYFYEELAQLNSSETYSWPTLVLPRSTQHIAIYTFVFYVLTYFVSNFRRFNVHTKVFRWMMTVYPIVTALTGFQVTHLVPYLTEILPHFLGLYTLTEAKEVVSHPYLTQAKRSSVLVESSEEAVEVVDAVFKNVSVSLPLQTVYKEFPGLR